MNEENYLVTCRCQQCNGNIEFDASLFQAGTMTTCPHCGIETQLFIPSASKVSEFFLRKFLKRQQNSLKKKQKHIVAEWKILWRK
jgi:hypothetical protein